MWWHATRVALDDPLEVTPSLRIPAHELSWRATASGGPGGQHANTANTRVEVVFDVTASEVLSEWQRQRLLERLGASVRIVVSDQRSQARNRALARERLATRLADALRTGRRRIATRPRQGAVEARLESKRHVAQRKRLRRDRPGPGDA
jgi:ribosome-associated protein